MMTERRKTGGTTRIGDRCADEGGMKKEKDGTRKKGEIL